LCPGNGYLFLCSQRPFQLDPWNFPLPILIITFPAVPRLARENCFHVFIEENRWKRFFILFKSISIVIAGLKLLSRNMDILRIYDGNVFIVIKSIIVVIQCSGIINSVNEKPNMSQLYSFIFHYPSVAITHPNHNFSSCATISTWKLPPRIYRRKQMKTIFYIA
jgi:hypothetical protein